MTATKHPAIWNDEKLLAVSGVEAKNSQAHGEFLNLLELSSMATVLFGGTLAIDVDDGCSVRTRETKGMCQGSSLAAPMPYLWCTNTKGTFGAVGAPIQEPPRLMMRQALLMISYNSFALHVDVMGRDREYLK